MVQQLEQQKYYYGTGKRKTAIAKVRLYQQSGSGEAGMSSWQVNGRPMEEFFPWAPWQSNLRQPLQVTDCLGKFRVIASVRGGGVSGQCDAIRHGISKALVAYDETLKPTLRRHGFVTRDARIKESKKYGLKRARRAPQYTKR